MNDTFQALYERLNAEQREAVDTIEGPVMVLAGPGTGKTQVLTLRIVHILRRTGVRPQQILALTFTESGKTAMRRRLAECIGTDAYRVGIFTFHGFCNHIIETHPDAFGSLVGREAGDEIGQIEAMEAAFEKAELTLLKPFGHPRYYVRPAQGVIAQLKRDGISPEAFAARAARDRERFLAIGDLCYDSGRYKGKMRGKYQKEALHIEKNIELARVYAGYQEALVARGIYDYDDMILEVVSVLSQNEALLLELHDRFQYILVDEHQDTNNAQNTVIELMTQGSGRPNLFVVGDEKQAIFRFQGASLENFLYFKQRYPDAKLITLVSNYRSTQVILDIAQSVIVNNHRSVGALIEGVRTDLVACSPYPLMLAERYELPDTESEYHFIARKIQEIAAAGGAPEEIAVLYRENREGSALGAVLGRMGVRYRIESARDVLDEPLIRQLLLLLRAVSEPTREDLLFQAVHAEFLAIDPFSIYRLTASGPRARLLEAMREERDDGALFALAEKLARWSARAPVDDAYTLMSAVIAESGLIPYALRQGDALRRMGELRALFKTVRALEAERRGFRLADFLRYVDLLEVHRIAIRDEPGSVLPGAARLMTAHGAKGLEFDYVFIINVTDGHWGNKRARTLFSLSPLRDERSGADESDPEEASLDEERRLFYVALTRARRMVFLSHARESLSGREQLPSVFLGEIRPGLIHEADGSRYEITPEERFGAPVAERKSALLSADERDMLVRLFYARPMSVSALNNFLACPWRYFYLSLVRMPRADGRGARYGRAVHGALKYFFDALKAGPAGKEVLYEAFARALDREALTTAEYETLHARGRRALEGYYGIYQGTWHTATENEYRIPGVALPDRGTVSGLQLTGILDKIEYMDAATVNVVDYKTGQPKTRNTLEGLTRSADGNYKRQLVFYRLLLETATPLRMASGVIDFVEPDKRGNYRKERFIIEDAEVAALRDLIYETAEKITSFAFWDERCGRRDCEFCRLRGLWP